MLVKNICAIMILDFKSIFHFTIACYEYIFEANFQKKNPTYSFEVTNLIYIFFMNIIKSEDLCYS